MNRWVSMGGLFVAGVLLARPVVARTAAEPGTLLVADPDAGRVLVLASTDLSLRRVLEVGPGARGIAMTKDGRQAAVSRPIYNAVTLIDCDQWTVEREVRLAGEQDRRPLDRRYYPVAAASWSGRWWVACGWRDLLVRLGKDGGAVERRIDLLPERGDLDEPQPVWPARLAVSPAGDLLFTGFRAGRIGRVTATRESDGPIRIEYTEPVALSPWALLVLDDQRIAVASIDDDQVVVLDAASLEVRARWKVGEGPMLLAAAQTPSCVLVGLRSGRAIIRLDLEDGETTARRDLGGVPGEICVVAGGRVVVVSLPSRGELLALSLPDLTPGTRVRVGGHPEGIAFRDARPPPAEAADDPSRSR